MSAEDRYRALLLHTPDPILTVDRDARVIAANPAACAALGATESALMRTQILSRVPEAEQRSAAMLLVRAFQGRSAEERVSMRCERGEVHCFLTRVIPIPQRGGSPLITMLMRDVTESDRLAEESRRRAHLERTPGQFMLTLDGEGRIEQVCGLEDSLGHADAEWIGQDARELLETGPQRDLVLAKVQIDLEEVGSWAGMQKCVRADGSRAPVRLFATPRLHPVNGESLGCYLSGLVLAASGAAGGVGMAADAAMPAFTLEAGGEAERVPRPRTAPAGLPVVAPDAPPTVLVIDDDETMRTVVRRFLERGGYSVVESFSGRNALSRLRDGTAVHFVVTDLKMADGSGGWLMAQLGYEFPELLPRTVVISGDATSAAAAHVGARWHCPVLAKPFTAAVLVNALVRLAGGAEEVA